MYGTPDNLVESIRNSLEFRIKYTELCTISYETHETICCLRNYFGFSAILTELSRGSVTRVRSLQQSTELKSASCKTY